MLCRAEFLAIPNPGGGVGYGYDTREGRSPADGSRVRVFVPVAALAGNASGKQEGAVSVWKVDPTGGRVMPQPVNLGHEIREDHRLVLEGLKPGDRVVLNPPSDLQPGDRFRPAASSVSKS
jgi:multidrug efflux pump subunit AcrA (membrane-fusion protein)